MATGGDVRLWQNESPVGQAQTSNKVRAMSALPRATVQQKGPTRQGAAAETPGGRETTDLRTSSSAASC
jgi:hypothetical protein